MNPAFATICVLAYVIGALPVGKWVAAAHGIDILSIGSGNIGATNVWRALGWRAGLSVFLVDAMKGYAPAYAAGFSSVLFGDGLQFLPDRALIAGGCAVIGHSASIFLRFKGGKSVATALGVVLAVTPDVACLSLALFLIVLAVSRYVSLGSIVGVVSAPVLAVAFNYPLIVTLAYALLASWIVYRHRENMQRLLKGTENRFGYGGGK